MCAHLRFEGNFPVLKDPLINNYKISAEYSDETFEAFSGIELNVVAFLSLINFITFSIPTCVNSLKKNKFQEIDSSTLFLMSKILG